MAESPKVGLQIDFAAEALAAFLDMGVCPAGYDREDLREFVARLETRSIELLPRDPDAGDSLQALLVTTLVESEYQKLLKWRDRFLEHDDGEDGPLAPPDNQLIAYAIADAEQLRKVEAALLRVFPPREEQKDEKTLTRSDGTGSPDRFQSSASEGKG